LSDTSKNELIVSGEERDERQSDSVYDFLYHDVRRVGSFLAQFDDAGHLQQVIQSESAVKGKKRGWGFKIGGSLAELASANVEGNRTPAEGGSEASERTYDPLWTNALTFLDFLEDRNMLRRDIKEARLGQFVLIGGLLFILDLVMFKNAWRRPGVKKLLQQQAKKEAQQKALEEISQAPIQNRHERRHQAKITQNKITPAIETDVDFILDMLSIMPHAIHARILGDGASAWGTLDERYIVGQASDLVLKHGVVVPGDWFMLGICDAFPSQHPSQEDIDAVAQIAGSFVGEVASKLAPATRQALGRPEWSYRVTPLLIFREISA
jgi:hypothetical protein